MKYKIIDEIGSYENVAIIGFGLEGQSTYRFIRRYLPKLKLTIIDYKDAVDILSEIRTDIYTEVIYGDGYLNDLNRFDLIFKSPGVSFKNLDKEILSQKITSQLEMVLLFNRDNMIGVTGTKGKSTTSSLIYNVIKDQGKSVCLVGNIGIPVFEQLDMYTNDTIVVTEMSCNQLEFVDVSPHIGVVLNVFQDHLDTIGSIENYEKAKMNMFLYQRETDYGIYDLDSSSTVRLLKSMNVKSNLFTVSLENDADIFVHNGQIFQEGNFLVNVDDVRRKLLGTHNLKNILFVLEIVRILNLDFDMALKTIESFVGLEHRMEFVGEFKNIKFYNDTIATVPEATMLACDTIDDLDTLIFGGQDRGIKYDEFLKYLDRSNIKNFICMPTTGHLLADLIDKGKHMVYVVNSLEEAVEVAYKVTAKEKSCLLSPAAASYEFFKNFEEKGKRYKELIKLYK